MIAKSFRIYELDDGQKYSFSTTRFNMAVEKYVKEHNCTKREVYECMADVVGVSFDAARKWAQGHNGPSSIEMIKQIAAYLNETLYYLLARESKEENNIMYIDNSTNIENTEKEVIDNTYKKLVDLFIYIFDIYRKPFFIDRREVVSDSEKEKMAEQKYEAIMNYIDENSLIISVDHWEKLRVIAHEVKEYAECRSSMPERWFRMNPLLDDALCLYCKENYDVDDFSNEEICEMRGAVEEWYINQKAPTLMCKLDGYTGDIKERKVIKDMSGNKIDIIPGKYNSLCLHLPLGTSRDDIMQTVNQIIGDDMYNEISIRRSDSDTKLYENDETAAYFCRYNFIKTLRGLFEFMF